MTHKLSTSTVQKWGNSFAIRIPASIAKNAHFQIGTVVELDAHDGTILVKATGQEKLTLEQRLATFNPAHHSGEVMQTKPRGKEKF